GGYVHIRDQHSRNIRHRRHQYLSGKAEIDPVRFSRSRADGAEGAPLRVPGKTAGVPIYAVLHEPAEEAPRRVIAPRFSLMRKAEPASTAPHCFGKTVSCR